MDELISSVDIFKIHPFPDTKPDPLGDKIEANNNQTPKDLSPSDKTMLFFSVQAGLKTESTFLDDAYDLKSLEKEETSTFEDYVEPKSTMRS